MSRASAAPDFADFFPTAPRAAKNKAKERQRAKSKALDSPSIAPGTPLQDGTNISKLQAEAGKLERGMDGSNSAVREPAPATLDENESPQGDLLNGVGSASSHASTISSVFSAPPATVTSSGPTNLNSLTPLTTADSSPPGRATSPHHSNAHPGNTSSHDPPADASMSKKQAPEAHLQLPEQAPQAARIYARDPNRGVKGEKCTYDPHLDPKLSSSDRKKAKPIYKVFGLVCT
jgi:histone-lysine N-methyltransferase SETD1